MPKQASITVGQRFVGTGPTPFGTPSWNVWVVDVLRRGNDGMLYAELINERDPGRRKTISAVALLDTRFYRPMLEAPSNSERPGHPIPRRLSPQPT